MATEPGDLIIAVREGTSWSRHLSITVPAERVQKTRGRIAEQIARRASLPGFRKGRLPQRVVEQRFGPSIDRETIDRLIQETYREALDRQGLTPISQGRVDDVKYDPGSDMTFEVEVEIRPEIELQRLSGFTVSRPPAVVEDTDVDAVLERLRDERAEWVLKEDGARPEYGDQTLVEISSHDEGVSDEPRAYRIVLGEGQAIPDVEAAILTLAPGESGDFEVAFPDDFPDESRRGQKQNLHIALKEVRRKVLPELDDQFAQSVGEFESLAALRERIQKDLEQDAADRAEAEVRRQLLNEIIAANEFDVPESMMSRYIAYMLGEGDPDEEDHKPHRSPEEEERLAQLRDALRPQAEFAVKRTLIIERIAEQEGLRATQDEIDERIEAIAERNNGSPSEVWIQFEKTGQLENLEREITEDKVFQFLKAQNTVA